MFALNTTKEGYVCTTSREIELSVRPIIFSLQIYFVGTRRGSDIFPVRGTGTLSQKMYGEDCPQLTDGILIISQQLKPVLEEERHEFLLR